MTTVAVVALGYVGLPLAISFGRQMRTIGFDIDQNKIAQYQCAVDPMGEVLAEQFHAASMLEFTSDPSSLVDADVVIIAVPTPVDVAHQPDFSPLNSASETVGRYLKSGAIVVYESTVYPGATEEICIPVLEQASGKQWLKDFNVAYSPERINPGDKTHTLHNVVKVVAGDTSATLNSVTDLYQTIVEAGVYQASSIKVAEAAKVIENTQRDLNIALMNELAIIFDKIGIDTLEVLEAAGTKWNFLPFRPGLVGGHCIGVDPYYLTHKAEMLGYHPDVILAGRRINDGMGKFIAEQTIKQMIANGSAIKGAKVNVLGLTFKENCADLRNSRVFDLIFELKSYGVDVHVFDPLVNEVLGEEYSDIKLDTWTHLPVADALVVAVAHHHFIEMSLSELLQKLKPEGVMIDVKSVFDRDQLKSSAVHLWRL